MNNLRARHRHLAFGLLFALAATVFTGTIGVHVYRLDFGPLATLCLPVVAVFFTFTSLLYSRGNTVQSRKSKLRTLFAAEIAMQATVWYLVGIVAGTSLYGATRLVDLQFDPAHPQWQGLWLLSFALPCGLMVRGMHSLMRAACVIAPQMLRSTSHYEVWRRIDQRAAALA